MPYRRVGIIGVGLVLGAWFLCAAAPAARAAEYWVDTEHPDASDANSGTRASGPGCP